MIKKYNISIVLLLSLSSLTLAQIRELSLNDLTNFKNPGKNWTLVGGIDFDPSKPQQLPFKPGTGILYNAFSQNSKEDLYTSWEHGDLDLEFEFIMPKNSNSGIYLMGRYEVQLMDSYGKTQPGSQDCGAIYERWDDSKPDGQKGFLGQPPIVNASRAPGLWQKMKIKFRAPVFEGDKKVRNARIDYVYLNDVLVQQNVVLSGPTRGALSGDEAPKGPLRIQGDHGVIAFRNIKYASYGTEMVQLQNLKYTYYENLNDKVKPTREGSCEALIDVNYASVDDKFHLTFSGDLVVPESDTYIFTPELNGGLEILVDGKKIAFIPRTGLDWNKTYTFEVALTKGKHTFVLNHWKTIPWYSKNLGIFISASTLQKQALHTLASHPPIGMDKFYPNDPMDKPKVVRAFAKVQDKIVTHAAFVGLPSKLAVALNPMQLSMFKIWKGNFVNMAGAWDGRGGNPVKPVGVGVDILTRPWLAQLSSANQIWPDSIPEPKLLKFKGYFIDESQKVHFNYLYDDQPIEETWYTPDGGKTLAREMKVQGLKNAYILIAESDQIKPNKDGSFTIGDQYYFLKVSEGAQPAKPIIRSENNTKQLIVPVSKTTEYIVTTTYTF